MPRHICASVTRIADLDGGFETRALPRADWATGDYVVGRVKDVSHGLRAVELPNGRMIEVMEDDLVVGAWGSRAATLEAVGDWQAIDAGSFELLTPAGLFGRITSCSPFLPRLLQLDYLGHALRDGRKLTMGGSVTAPPPTVLRAPVVLIVGTSMSAGKTLSGRQIVHYLAQSGRRVVGAKLTGAARYRDVLSFGDAGASSVYDFVDAGLPSTVCAAPVYREALGSLLSRVALDRPDVVVAEAGASPLEPYNGDTAIDMIGAHVRFTLLCAQDPYAVLGVTRAFEREPDLVAGGAANTSAAVALVKKLTGLTALNLLEPESAAALGRLLEEALA